MTLLPDSTNKVDDTPTWKRHANRAGIVLLVLVTAAMATVGVLIVANALRWDPLGDYPLQIAAPTMETEPGATGSYPTVYLDGDVEIDAVKCTAGDQRIQVTGVLSWISDQPPGNVVDVGYGGGQRGPGCVSYRFWNPIPPPVIERCKAMAARGIESSVWHLTGTETPVREDGSTGVDRSWSSTSIRIIHSPRG